MLKIKECLTNNNSYDTNEPGAIVFHNTDNYSATADARAHATGLWDGYMKGMSWHVVVDDKEAWQCLPYKRGAWHVGVNYGGKLFGKINNRNSICVEMCVNAGYNYEQAFLNSVDVVRQLMAMFNIPAERVYSHYDICGKNCPSQVRAHGDWTRFKQLIGSKETDYAVSAEVQVEQLYRVRLTWADSGSQTNAYRSLDLAKADADRHPGYSVFDPDGKVIYTSAKQGESYTPAEWIAMIAPIAQDLARIYKILPSVIIAQTALETGWGSTDLTRRYNIVGMKSDLINGSWKQYTTWSGEIYRKQTTEYVNGRLTRPDDDFRVYHSFRECLEDYENFLLHVQNAKGYKYRRIQGWTDPLKVISAIRIGTGTNGKPEGYFTDPDYVTKIMNLINSYGLTKYDTVMTGEEEKPQKEETEQEKTKQAEQGTEMKTVKSCVEKYDSQRTKDTKAGDPWIYSNSGCSGTFAAAVKAKNRKANCATLVNWILRELGVTKSGMYVWAGNDGIHWSSETEKAIKEKCYVIPVKGKTAKQCIQKGIMQPWDMVLHDAQHTNIYAGNDVWYDAGRGNTKGCAEGSPFVRWKCTKKNDESKLAYLIRPHGSTLVRRVQIGAFSSETKAKQRKTKCKKLTGFEAFMEYMADEQWHVFCGSFTGIIGANERLAIMKKHFKGSFIKDVYI